MDIKNNYRHFTLEIKKKSCEIFVLKISVYQLNWNGWESFPLMKDFFPLRHLYYILECDAISQAQNKFIDETLILKKKPTHKLF